MSRERAYLGRKLVIYSLRVKREKMIALHHIIAHLERQEAIQESGLLFTGRDGCKLLAHLCQKLQIFSSRWEQLPNSRNQSKQLTLYDRPSLREIHSCCSDSGPGSGCPGQCQPAVLTSHHRAFLPGTYFIKVTLYLALCFIITGQILFVNQMRHFCVTYQHNPHHHTKRNRGSFWPERQKGK